MNMIQDYEILRNEEPQTKRSPWIELIMALVFIQTLLFLLPAGSGAANAVPADAIQIRIVANSNSKEDQEVKWLIQQEIQPLLQKVGAKLQTPAELDLALMNLSSEITNKAKDITEHAINISLGETLIPPKSDGTNYYAQDFHHAFVVTIGSGKGDNWWCALFPKICYQEEDEEKIEKIEKEPVKFWTWEWIKSKF